MRGLILHITQLLAVLLSCSAFGQTSFQKTYGGIGDDVAYSLCATADRGWVIAGYTTSFGSGGWDVYVLKLDSICEIQWSRTYGGQDNDVANFITQTSDGGYMIAGNTESYGTGGKDAFAIKTDGNGAIQWSKTFGGSGDESFQSVCETSNGEYVFAGYTSTFSDGGLDFYVVKTSGNGSLQWSKTFGEFDDEYANSIIQTNDGGYMAGGSNLSYGSGLYDNYLVKMDASGNLQWNKTIGGTNHDGIRAINQLPTGDYIMVGNTYSFAVGVRDVYLVKTDSQGLLKWSKTYGGSGDDHGWEVKQTNDSGFICVGFTTSFGSGSNDVFLVKTDSSGTLQWSKTYGGTAFDDGWSVFEVQGGGYLIAGYTSSFGAGGRDIYLIKTDANGDVCCNTTSPNAITTSPLSIVTIPIPVISSPVVSSFQTIPSDTLSPLIQNYCVKPEAEFSDNSRIICENSCIDFVDASTNNPTSWEWIFPGATPSVSTVQSPTGICYPSLGVHDVSLIVSNGNCSDTITKQNYVSVNDTCNYFVVSDTLLCIGDCVTFSAVVPATVSEFQWLFLGGTPSVSTGNTATICYYDEGIFDATLIYQDSTNSDTLFRQSLIIVVTPEEVSVTTSDTIVSSGSVVQLNVSPSGTIEWSPILQMSCADCPNPTVQVNETTTFLATVTDQYGCISSDSITIEVIAGDCEKAIMLPSAFSPNSDGNNEFIQAFENETVSDFHLKIFNRWGETVFESNLPETKWDGSYKGAAQDIQVFAYLVQYSCRGENFLKTGNITLIR